MDGLRGIERILWDAVVGSSRVSRSVMAGEHTMTSTHRGPAHAFALIGRSYPSETFEDLYRASLSARRERRGRGGSWDGVARVWRGSNEPVTLPLRFP